MVIFLAYGDRWRHDTGQESDITFVLETDVCESNGAVSFQIGHLEGNFSIIPVFYSFRRHHHECGDRWRHDTGQESDITFVLKIDVCESNGAFRYKNRYQEGWLLYDSCDLFFRLHHHECGDCWRHDTGQESDISFFIGNRCLRIEWCRQFSNWTSGR